MKYQYFAKLKLVWWHTLMKMDVQKGPNLMNGKKNITHEITFHVTDKHVEIVNCPTVPYLKMLEKCSFHAWQFQHSTHSTTLETSSWQSRVTCVHRLFETVSTGGGHSQQLYSDTETLGCAALAELASQLIEFVSHDSAEKCHSEC